VLEAFSAGLPVVSTHWRGIPDQIESGKNGFLHAPGQVAEMAQSLARLAQDPALCQTMGQQNRADFESRHTMAIFEKKVLHFFTHLA